MDSLTVAMTSQKNVGRYEGGLFPGPAGYYIDSILNHYRLIKLICLTLLKSIVLQALAKRFV
jgi:hypothetical protein